jgi:hypothetical protein
MLRVSLLVAALLIAARPQPLLTLEIRVFQGSEDVTSQTRIAVHRAGERGQPLAHLGPGEMRATLAVAPGIYDAQAVREAEGQVISIRWAERLVVMPYPDERGHHLEVINLTNGYGALQLRGDDETRFALFAAGDRNRPIAETTGEGFSLFVVPAGRYDIQVNRGARGRWHTDVEVPLDRTRLWIAQ